jgi:hypothetical protein
MINVFTAITLAITSSGYEEIRITITLQADIFPLKPSSKRTYPIIAVSTT